MLMPEDIRIRPMVPADIDAVMAIAASLANAPHWPRTAYETALAPAATPRRIALVGEASTEPIGFAIAFMIPPCAELETIAISQSYQRRGVGSALLEAMLRRLESLETTEITLEVRASNLAAQAFYRAHSFDAVARRSGYYADEEDAVLMRAILLRAQK
jgi:[ribosomal protein S18]-alanine N-acetyltransferase